MKLPVTIRSYNNNITTRKNKTLPLKYNGLNENDY